MHAHAKTINLANKWNRGRLEQQRSHSGPERTPALALVHKTHIYLFKGFRVNYCPPQIAATAKSERVRDNDTNTEAHKT